MTKLALVEVRQTDKVRPRIFHEKDAVKYIGSNRTHFKELVRAGVIPFASHMYGKARIYRQDHLDSYIESLNWHTMEQCENPPVSLKGVSR